MLARIGQERSEINEPNQEKWTWAFFRIFKSVVTFQEHCLDSLLDSEIFTISWPDVKVEDFVVEELGSLCWFLINILNALLKRFSLFSPWITFWLSPSSYSFWWLLDGFIVHIFLKPKYLFSTSPSLCQSYWKNRCCRQNFFIWIMQNYLHYWILWDLREMIGIWPMMPYLLSQQLQK